MKIGELGRRTATKVETIRYYERVGLLPPPERTEGNYRSYAKAHVQRLSFIRHARGLGFDIAEIRSLLDLADQPERECEEVDRIATGHLEAVEEKIAQLEKMRRELARMVGQCRGGRVASCHVLEVLADHALCSTDHAPAGTPLLS
ncbi:helix-turn-helix domain-containing protein [Sphingosinicella sp. GR2756]|uniref:Helix-turn-helix domain-containing protein n=2 Tax=Sphingosinicella rhizophila TaxID=3050082 RepID=A0ABU3QBE4_9SPHN|nr:helix-turn-helix domain-containing protein [Sphingosinicella sp. GR2756]MDT9600712.1 helix-turn-helix domain-containing protein [Sphingosinicella sp. GR2756]